MTRSAVRVLAWTAVSVALVGCGGVSTAAVDAVDQPAPEATTTTITTTTPTSTTVGHACVDETASYRPVGPNPAPGAMPEGTTMYDIQDREVLRVGVDETTQGLAYRDPATGEIRGMEVDLAYEIARRIIGDRPPGDILELVPVTTDEKIAAVENGDVDLTIDAVSMSCDRWQDVAFSTEYLTTDQQFLVRADSPIVSDADLDGRTVCVTAGSSSIGILHEHAPDAELLEVDTRTECLVALQQGRADAYFSHETFLSGMVPQDPTLEIRRDVLPTGDITSHYGIAVSHGNHDLVRFVNQALEDMRADGTWDRLHDVLEEEPCLPGARPTVSPPAGSLCSDRLGLPDAAPPVAAYLPAEAP